MLSKPLYPMPLKKVLERLPAAKFQRICRSLKVAWIRSSSIHHRNVQLNGVQLPVNESDMDFVRKWMRFEKSPLIDTKPRNTDTKFRDCPFAVILQR